MPKSKNIIQSENSVKVQSINIMRKSQYLNFDTRVVIELN